MGLQTRLKLISNFVTDWYLLLLQAYKTFINKGLLIDRGGPGARMGNLPEAV
jgi:hypothetical protein